MMQEDTPVEQQTALGQLRQVEHCLSQVRRELTSPARACI